MAKHALKMTLNAEILLNAVNIFHKSPAVYQTGRYGAADCIS
jgi:hypothetical protein